MNDYIRATTCSAILCFSVSAMAVSSTNTVEKLPNLEQESQHSASAKRISSHFLRSHYKPIELNDELSS